MNAMSDEPTSTVISVRIPTAQAERLRAVADERMVGIGLVVARAVAEYLDRLPSLEASLTPQPPKAANT